MIPVFSTGLHCDATLAEATITAGGVIPVFSTGLHCDPLTSSTTVGSAATLVIPVFSTGLHCDGSEADYVAYPGGL